MRPLRTLAMVLAAVLTAAPALAGDPNCTVQDYTKASPPPNFNCPGPLEETMVPAPATGPKDSVSLQTGKPAPWDGILMDKDRVIQLGLRITGLRRLRWNDGLTAVDKTKAEVKLATDSLTADLGLAKSQRESYKQQLTATQEELKNERRWYKSWTFGLIVGVVVTSATAITLAYVARK